MKKQSLFSIFMTLCVTLVMTSCSDDNNEPVVNPNQLKTSVLKETAHNVYETAYTALNQKTTALLEAVKILNNNTTEANLETCQNLWKETRAVWEQSEAWLFGPVSTDNIDPRIDTWPIDMNKVDAILAGTQTLDETYMDALPDAAKGFHPIELLLWGENGDKAAADFTAREKEYLLALAKNLNKLTGSVKNSWVNGFTAQFATAGNGSTKYDTQFDAYKDLVSGMAGICDEVANVKIKTPFDLQDPTQAESPFALNSITDFTNNIKGIMDVYQGKFTQNGKGIEDLVSHYNLSLDNKIKQKHAAALASLEAIQVPFGEAILNNPTKVQNAIDKINALKTVLENDLMAFVKKYTK